jgi:tetratricopeptide (TPR) repeat protein
MGSKRAGKRKHLFLCLACSIVLSLMMDGCVHLHVTEEGEEDLERARSLMRQGAFEASLRESQEVLRRYPQSQGDHALFQMGLIYANPQNPNSDYQKSLVYFQRLKREFPRSDLRSDAEVWILVLQKISEKDKDIEILKKIWTQKAKELAEKQEDVNKLGNQVEGLQNQTKSLKRQIGELNQQIKDFQKQIKQLKEIDLGIEKKRRDALQK